jgi:hypothetical protein
VSELTAIERAWYTPAPAMRLGLLRIAIGGYWLYRLLDTREKNRGVVSVDVANWAPVGVAGALGGPVAPAVFGWVYDAAILLCVAWTLGLGWRVVGPTFAAALLAIMSYRLSFGHLHHESHLPTLHVLALSLAPAGSAASVDARLWPARAARPGESWRWGWPIRLVCAITALSYLVAGIAKVTGDAGWSWGAGLLGQVGYVALGQDFLASGGLPAVRFLYGHPTLAVALGTLSLVLELGGVLALLDRRVAWAWIPGIMGMHWGIKLVMGIVFPYPLCGVAFLSFLPLERLLPRRFHSHPVPA